MGAGHTTRHSGSTKYVAVTGGEEYHIGIERGGAVTLNELPRDVHLESIDGESLFSLLVGNRSYEVFVAPGEEEYSVIVEGERYRVRVVDERPTRPAGPPDRVRPETRAAAAPATLAERERQRRPEAGAGAVTSPMTGVLVEILVAEGQNVEAGDGVAILEAMKTRNVIRSPRNGAVSNLQVAVGETVRMDHVIMYIDAQ